MPKHLTNIPIITELPDTAGLPDGYPVVFDGAMHVIVDDDGARAFVPVGSGGIEVVDELPANPTDVGKLYLFENEFYVVEDDGKGLVLRKVGGDSGGGIEIVDELPADPTEVGKLYLFENEIYIVEDNRGDLVLKKITTPPSTKVHYSDGIAPPSEYEDDLDDGDLIVDTDNNAIYRYYYDFDNSNYNLDAIGTGIPFVVKNNQQDESIPIDSKKLGCLYEVWWSGVTLVVPNLPPVGFYFYVWTAGGTVELTGDSAFFRSKNPSGSGVITDERTIIRVVHTGSDEWIIDANTEEPESPPIG